MTDDVLLSSTLPAADCKAFLKPVHTASAIASAYADTPPPIYEYIIFLFCLQGLSWKFIFDIIKMLHSSDWRLAKI